MFGWDTTLMFITASALLALAPGPDNIFVLKQSALFGTGAGLNRVAGAVFAALAIKLSLIGQGS